MLNLTYGIREGNNSADALEAAAPVARKPAQETRAHKAATAAEPNETRLASRSRRINSKPATAPAT